MDQWDTFVTPRGRCNDGFKQNDILSLSLLLVGLNFNDGAT